MLNFLKKTEDEELVINITSMIDVIFILLIFFMVSTQFKKNSLPLDLPKSEDTTKEDSTLKVLAVSKDEIQFDGISLSMTDLDRALSEYAEKMPGMAVSLECERTVNFERIVQILTKLQNAGISRIGIVHEQTD